MCIFFLPSMEERLWWHFHKRGACPFYGLHCVPIPWGWKNNMMWWRIWSTCLFSLISCSKRSLKWILFLKNAFLLWILLTKLENFNKFWELIWYVLNAIIKQSSAEHLFSKNFGGVFVCVSVSECSVCMSAGLHVHICGLAEVIACPSLSLFPCSFENPPLRQNLSWNLEFMGLSARPELKELHSPLVSILVRAGLTGAHRTLGLLSSCW